MCCTGHLPSSSPGKSSSIRGVSGRGGLPLALQATHQSLDALQLVHRVLHGGFGGRGPPGGSARLVIAVVLQSRAGLPAAWFRGLGAGVEAPREARGEQAGALGQRDRELVGVEAEPGPRRAQEGVPGEGAGGAGGREGRGGRCRRGRCHVGVGVGEEPSEGRHGDALGGERTQVDN